MLVFSDSHDHYTAPSQKYETVVGNPTISSAAARNGSQGMLCSGAQQYVVKNLPATNAGTFINTIGFGQATGSNTGELDLTWGNGQGNALIVYIGVSTIGINLSTFWSGVTVTDTYNNTYKFIGNSPQAQVGSFFTGMGVFVANNIVGQNSTLNQNNTTFNGVTVSWSLGGIINSTVVIEERRGIAVSVFTDGVKGTSTNNYTPNSNFLTGPITTTNARDLLVSCFMDQSGSGFNFTVDSGFTIRSNYQDNNNSVQLATADLMVASTNTYSANWTSADSGSNNMVHGIFFGLIATAPTVTVGTAIQMQSNATEEAIIMLGDAGTMQDYVTLDGSGTFRAYRGGTWSGVSAGTGGTLLGTGSISIAANVWYFLEVQFLIDSAAGTVVIRLIDNGNTQTILNLSGQNTKNASDTNVTQVALGNCTNNSSTFVFDDTYVTDGTGAYNTGFLGDVRISAILPTGNGTQNNFKQGGSSLSTNWGQVDEIPPDGDTSYVFDRKVNDQDRYVYPAIAGNGPVSAVVNWLNVRNDQPAAPAHLVRGVTKSAGTVGDSGIDLPVPNSYAYEMGVIEANPGATPGAPTVQWQMTSVNAAEFGIEITK